MSICRDKNVTERWCGEVDQARRSVNRFTSQLAAVRNEFRRHVTFIATARTAKLKETIVSDKKSSKQLTLIRFLNTKVFYKNSSRSSHDTYV